MKRISFLMFAFVAVFSAALAQEKAPSPKAEAAGTVGGAKVKVAYSAPSARGRKVIGGLVPYGEVWRTGANEATTIEFDKPVKIEGKDLAAGKYALFTIPGEKEWTIIFNKENKQWGHYDYKQASDVLRVTAKPTKTDSMVETFKIDVVKDEVVMKWENTAVAFKVKG